MKKIIVPILLLALCFSNGYVYSQNITVSSDSIKVDVGAILKYKIKVSVNDSLQKIDFPKDSVSLRSFSIINSKVDTLNKHSPFTVQKIYQLSNFDSGIKVIPSQNILINDTLLVKTDSLLVEIRDLAVDTISKKFYDIKPIVSVDQKTITPWTTIFVISFILIAIGVGVYWYLFKRKREITEEEKVASLSSFDRALYNLEKLKTAKYILHSDFKSYYTELTDIFRNYISEVLHVHALESTTDELIEELKNSSHQLDNSIIKKMRVLLENADLVKFAKFFPETNVAAKDFDFISQTIMDIKSLLPEEVTEEEKESIEKEKTSKKRKTTVRVIAIAGGVILLSVLTWLLIPEAKTKELAQKKWFMSQYDFPPTTIETPEILRRQANQTGENTFTYGSLSLPLYIELKHYKKQSPSDSLVVNDIIDKNFAFFEKQKATNILTKQEEYITPFGKKGIRIYGQFRIENPLTTSIQKKIYSILLFNENGIVQKLSFIYHGDDEDAKVIVKRIQNSLKFTIE